jgi:hypothetical protein
VAEKKQINIFSVNYLERRAGKEKSSAVKSQPGFK